MMVRYNGNRYRWENGPSPGVPIPIQLQIDVFIIIQQIFYLTDLVFGEIDDVLSKQFEISHDKTFPGPSNGTCISNALFENIFPSNTHLVRLDQEPKHN